MAETQDPIQHLPSPEPSINYTLYQYFIFISILYLYLEYILEGVLCGHLYRHLICKTDITVRKHQGFFLPERLPLYLSYS